MPELITAETPGEGLLRPDDLTANREASRLKRILKLALPGRRVADIKGGTRLHGPSHPLGHEGTRTSTRARKLGLTEVPVIVLDHLTEAQKRAYVIADNKLAENAGWDDDMLRGEIEALQDESFDVSLLGLEDVELAQLLAAQDAAEGLTDEDAVPELLEKRTPPYWRRSGQPVCRNESSGSAPTGLACRPATSGCPWPSVGDSQLLQSPSVHCLSRRLGREGNGNRVPDAG